MIKSPNIGLHLVPASDDTKYFKDWRVEMSGDDETSNMMIIDSEIQGIKSKMSSKIIYSETQPANQENEGDIWNEIL